MVTQLLPRHEWSSWFADPGSARSLGDRGRRRALPLIERADDVAVRLARLLVALGVVVIDTVPHATDVHVADHLAIADLRLELHPLVAERAVDRAPGLDVAEHCSAPLLGDGGTRTL